MRDEERNQSLCIAKNHHYVANACHLSRARPLTFFPRNSVCFSRGAVTVNNLFVFGNVSTYNVNGRNAQGVPVQTILRFSARMSR